MPPESRSAAAVDPAAQISELQALGPSVELTQHYVAEQLDWSLSKIIRIENAPVTIGVTDLQDLLGLYDVADKHAIGNLVTMARGSKRRPVVDCGDTRSETTVLFIAYESSALLNQQIQPLVIPGLLQTEEYRSKLAIWPGVTESVRVGRQPGGIG